MYTAVSDSESSKLNEFVTNSLCGVLKVCTRAPAPWNQWNMWKSATATVQLENPQSFVVTEVGIISRCKTFGV